MRATALAVFVRLGLWFLPFQTLRELLRRFSGGSISPSLAATASSRLSWAVQAAARRIPGASCLTQGLVLQHLLARSGRNSALHIGVCKDAPHGFQSHAWVESGGEVLLGNNGGLDRYSPILSVSRESA